MEILNTPENKAGFMAQYYGQKVVSHPLWDKGKYVEPKWYIKASVFNEPNLDGYFLELRPLSSITGDEAIEVLNFMGFNSANYGNLARATILALFVISSNDVIKYELIVKQMLFDFGDISSAVEKIRSMGFSYKWRGLPVEKQIEYNWIKLI